MRRAVFQGFGARPSRPGNQEDNTDDCRHTIIIILRKGSRRSLLLTRNFFGICARISHETPPSPPPTTMQCIGHCCKWVALKNADHLSSCCYKTGSNKQHIQGLNLRWHSFATVVGVHLCIPQRNVLLNDHSQLFYTENLHETRQCSIQ